MREIKTVAVIGLGTMGHGIAQVFAMAGFNVVGFESDAKRAAAAVDAIGANLRLFASEGLVAEGQVASMMSRVTITTTAEEAACRADYIVEAIPEILKPKQDLTRLLSRAAADDVVIATNTSGLDPTEIAKAAEKPERVISAHFWNPPHLLPLVEITRGERTSDETLTVTVDLLKRAGKEPVVLKNYVPGFIGNRLQWALMREALSLVENGIADPSDVDAVMTNSLGRRYAAVGPFETVDMGGLDIHLAVGTYLLKVLDKSTSVSPILREKVENGDLGLKTGRGFYNWSGGEGAAKCQARDHLLMEFLRAEQQ